MHFVKWWCGANAVGDPRPDLMIQLTTCIDRLFKDVPNHMTFFDGRPSAFLLQMLWEDDERPGFEYLVVLVLELLFVPGAGCVLVPRCWVDWHTWDIQLKTGDGQWQVVPGAREVLEWIDEPPELFY